MDNTCICCGDVIPEGRWVCYGCENYSNIRLKAAVEIYF